MRVWRRSRRTGARTASRASGLARIAAAVGLGLLVAGSRAMAGPIAFYSPNDDGTQEQCELALCACSNALPPCAEPDVAYGLMAVPGTASVPLYLDWGPNPSTTGVPCEDASANGDEICGFDVTIQVVPVAGGPLPVLIQGFVPDVSPGKSIAFKAPPPAGTGALRINGVIASPSPGPTRVGELLLSGDGSGCGPGGACATLEVRGITAQQPDGSLRLVGMEAVRADLSVGPIAPPTAPLVWVPEPAEWLLLASGVAGLAGLHRWRGRRSRRCR